MCSPGQTRHLRINQQQHGTRQKDRDSKKMAPVQAWHNQWVGKAAWDWPINGRPRRKDIDSKSNA
jgi:hypothetical protein